MRTKYAFFYLAFLILAACSSNVTKNQKIKSVDPAKNFGFKKNEKLEDMVAYAKTAGDRAVEFLSSDLFIKGNDASIRGDYVTAAEIFKYVVELNPSDHFVKKKLAVELIRVGDLKEAEKLLEPLYISSNKKDETIGIVLAGIYSATDRTPMAKQVYQEIIKLGDDIEEACLFLAKSYTAEKKFNEAHGLLQKCEKKNKEDPVYTFYQGKIEFDRGNKELAKKYFERSLKIDHSYFQAVVALGSLYEEKDDLKSAIKLYKEFLSRDGNGNNVSVLSKLVSVLFTAGSSEEVIPYAETLSSLDGSDLNLKVRLGLLYTDAEKYEEAKSIFQDVLAVVPESDKVTYYLAILHVQTNQIENALDYFKKIPEASPLYGDSVKQMAQIYGGLARDEFFEGKSIEKSNYFLSFIKEKSKKLEEHAIEFKMLEASYYEETSQLSKAINGMSEVRMRKEFNDTHLYYLASLYEKNGESLEARKLMHEIVERDPKNAHALNFLGYSYLDKNEKMDLAFEYIFKASKLKPDDGYIRDSLAWYYYQVGKFQEALVEAKKAVELVKSDVTITKHLGMIYQKLKRFDKAKEFLNEALASSKEKTERDGILKLLEEIEPIRLPASDSK